MTSQPGTPGMPHEGAVGRGLRRSGKLRLRQRPTKIITEAHPCEHPCESVPGLDFTRTATHPISSTSQFSQELNKAKNSNPRKNVAP